jgi:hypothetical protein
MRTKKRFFAIVFMASIWHIQVRIKVFFVPSVVQVYNFQHQSRVKTMNNVSIVLWEVIVKVDYQKWSYYRVIFHTKISLK